MIECATFSKVSFNQFYADCLKCFGADSVTEEIAKSLYDGIKLPKRGTAQSAGYDFFTPVNIGLHPNEAVVIPTGIRCEMNDGWVLSLHMRSSLGFKYFLGLANTTGVIDADYYSADNEGHIMAKLVNRGSNSVGLNIGDKFMQGIFTQYGITTDDDATGERTGGIGSTGK